MIEEAPELRDQVADSLLGAWKYVGGSELTGPSPEEWLILADAAIAAIEYDHTLLVSAGLLVAVYSDCVLDLRWDDDEADTGTASPADTGRP